MSEKTEIAAEAAAVKAYAAATEAVTGSQAGRVAVSPALSTEAPVEFPSKAKRAARTVTIKAAPVAARAAAKPAPKKAAPIKRAGKPKPAPALAEAAPNIRSRKNLFQQLKDTTTMNATEFTTKIKAAVNEAQTKAKEALGKGAATFTEYNEFSKGNVEAVVASGKILAGGLQTLGRTYVEDGKTAFAALTGEVKELAAVKSPSDLFKFQTELLRRNFDAVVAATSKNSEAVLKLAGEAAAPISARVSLAVDKVKKAA